MRKSSWQTKLSQSNKIKLLNYMTFLKKLQHMVKLIFSKQLQFVVLFMNAISCCILHKIKIFIQRLLTFVTESLTFIAGTFSNPSLNNLYKLWTPVVVSSLSPLQSFKYSGNFVCTRFVRSPPSSRIRLKGSPSGKIKVCSMHQIYSSSVSPFHA